MLHILFDRDTQNQILTLCLNKSVCVCVCVLTSVIHYRCNIDSCLHLIAFQKAVLEIISPHRQQAWQPRALFKVNC